MGRDTLKALSAGLSCRQKNKVSAGFSTGSHHLSISFKNQGIADLKILKDSSASFHFYSDLKTNICGRILAQILMHVFLYYHGIGIFSRKQKVTSGSLAWVWLV